MSIRVVAASSLAVIVGLSACLLDRAGGLDDASTTTGPGAGGTGPTGPGGGGSGATGGAPNGGGGTGGTSPGTPTGTSTGSDCVLDPGEECEDCNQAAGDGCDAGAIEPGYSCSNVGELCLHVSGFEEGSATDLPVLGGSGGAGIPAQSCPNGEVIVGVTVEDATACNCGSLPNGIIGSLRFLCAPVAVGASGALGWVGPPTPLPRIGGVQGVGGVLGDLTCSNDAYVVGLAGDSGTSYDVLTTLRVDCAPFAFQRSTSGGSIEMGRVTSTNTLGQGSVSQTVSCPAGAIVTGIDGSQGALVDTLVASCSPISATFCGDATTDPHEGCDDGNPVAGDGCDTLCQTE